jgi:serine/threonine protein kinase
MTTLTGQTIAGYRIHEELGRGGMGVVFRAQQLSVDRPVAIKFLAAQKAEDQRSVARFLREAKAAGKLAHPNVVSVYDAGNSDGLHYIVMELIDGPSAQKRIRERGAFSEEETLAIAAQIAEALRFAHGHGILHRDVKPDNFLIDARGQVRLADLGLARFVSGAGNSTELTQDGATLGTPRYMSPEQCKGSNVDARSDLYSLGASMYMLATGKPPFEGPGPGAVIARVLSEPPAPVQQANPNLSPDFVALVERLMQKDPSRRYASAEEVVTAIQRCRKKSAALKPASEASPRRGLRWKPVLAGGVCAIIFLIVVGQRDHQPPPHRSDTAGDMPDQAAAVTLTATATSTKSEIIESTNWTMSGDPRELEAKQLFNQARGTADRDLMRQRVTTLVIDYADTQFVKTHSTEIEQIGVVPSSSLKK